VPIRTTSAAAAPASRHDAFRTYVWLDQVVVANVQALFPDLRVTGAYRFRLLREVDVPPQTAAGASDVERVLDVLRRRETNPVAVLVADRRMPAGMFAGLVQGVGIPRGSVHRTGTVSDLRRLWEVSRIPRPDLKAPSVQPRTPASLEAHTDVYAAARDRDVLFHHPFESFQPIVEMIKQAADDPSVLSISTTLYRTDRESPMVHALLDAARRGRTVRVLIELNARLDEHRNVNWWRAFEQAGAQVFAAPPGLKVHAKMTLIARQEGGGVRRYAHLSSGNYNAFTARVYTDLGLLTCDNDITADVASLFDGLCGGASTNRFLALAVSPLTLRQALAALVDREIACHRRSGQGHIILKMNGLVDRDVIRMLYRASQEGVTVDLLVRGICCLRPGVPGMSDRIRVRSIVGRFLEHSRAWYFRNGGEGDVYIGSADLMPRNLDRRIEVMAPVKEAALRRRVLDILLRYMADNVKARELRADGRYTRITPPLDQRAIDTQLDLLHEGERLVTFGE
jgi:polyphosphate kinase